MKGLGVAGDFCRTGVGIFAGMPPYLGEVSLKERFIEVIFFRCLTPFCRKVDVGLGVIGYLNEMSIRVEQYTKVLLENQY